MSLRDEQKKTKRKKEMKMENHDWSDTEGEENGRGIELSDTQEASLCFPVL